MRLCFITRDTDSKRHALDTLRFQDGHQLDIDADSAFAVTFKHEETLAENSRQDPCLQCALLYTNGAGQRRIRVITLGLKATSQVSSLHLYPHLYPHLCARPSYNHPKYK